MDKRNRRMATLIGKEGFKKGDSLVIRVLCVCVCVCSMCACVHVCFYVYHGMCVEVRGHFRSSPYLTFLRRATLLFSSVDADPHAFRDLSSLPHIFPKECWDSDTCTVYLGFTGFWGFKPRPLPLHIRHHFFPALDMDFQR